MHWHHSLQILRRDEVPAFKVKRIVQFIIYCTIVHITVMYGTDLVVVHISETKCCLIFFSEITVHSDFSWLLEKQNKALSLKA